MAKKIIIYITYVGLVAGIVLGLFNVAYAATGNIDDASKWTWSTNVGWINFNPDHGGVTVYADHLEGYAWGESIGWIKLGANGGGSPYYANTTKDNYGVNRDSSGNLSGYAWGTNVGWINFSPDNYDEVSIAPNGEFAGYAWSESIGWISFKGEGGAGATAYGVVTNFRGGIYLPLVIKN